MWEKITAILVVAALVRPSNAVWGIPYCTTDCDDLPDYPPMNFVMALGHLTQIASDFAHTTEDPYDIITNPYCPEYSYYTSFLASQITNGVNGPIDPCDGACGGDDCVTNNYWCEGCGAPP